jgi:predicted AAA+ superfamily ATPase
MNKNNGDWLEISDLNIFTDYVRNVVYANFIDTEAEQDDYNEIDLIKTLTDLSPEEKEELENVLNQQECLNIVKATSKKIRHKKTKQIKYLVNDQILYDIVQNINQRMVSNIISNLVKKGFLESAFDEEKNDFIFWKKEIKNGDSQT